VARRQKGDVVTVIVAGIQDNGIDVTVRTASGFIRKSELSRDRSEQRPDRYATSSTPRSPTSQGLRRGRAVGQARELDEEKKAMADFGSSGSGASLGDIAGGGAQPAEEGATKK
jgi:small subunit ribosomal protein S1